MKKAIENLEELKKKCEVIKTINKSDAKHRFIGPRGTYFGFIFYNEIEYEEIIEDIEVLNKLNETALIIKFPSPITSERELQEKLLMNIFRSNASFFGVDFKSNSDKEIIKAFKIVTNEIKKTSYSVSQIYKGLSNFRNCLIQSNNLNIWEYGTLNGQAARRNKLTKKVQFILWKAGEQGHEEDCWHNFDKTYWKDFSSE